MTETTPIEKRSLQNLVDIRTRLAETVEGASADIKKINTEINRRYLVQVQDAYKAADKESGILNVDLPDGWKIKASKSKSVKYDSDTLMGVASAMPWEQAQKLFKVSVGMTESLYKALDAVDPELKKKIDEGRTVTIGDPSLTIIPPAA